MVKQQSVPDYTIIYSDIVRLQKNNLVVIRTLGKTGKYTQVRLTGYGVYFDFNSKLYKTNKQNH